MTHIYIKPSSNQRSTTSREASAAGRLRPNAVIGKGDNWAWAKQVDQAYSSRKVVANPATLGLSPSETAFRKILCWSESSRCLG